MTPNSIDIYKVGGILIQDRKLLVERSHDRDFFVAPGGGIEKGETAIQALIRELAEEFSITVTAEDFQLFGIFRAKAAGDESKKIRMDVFMVKSWQGELQASGEVAEFRWISFNQRKEIKLGSIFDQEVIPRLKQRNIID